MKNAGQPMMEVNLGTNNLKVERQQDYDTMHNVIDNHCLQPYGPTEPISNKDDNHLENKILLQSRQDDTMCDAVDTKPGLVRSEQTQNIQINLGTNNFKGERQQDDDTTHDVVYNHFVTEPISIKDDNHLDNKILLQRRWDDTMCDAVDTKPVLVRSEEMQCTQNIEIKQEVNTGTNSFSVEHHQDDRITYDVVDNHHFTEPISIKDDTMCDAVDTKPVLVISKQTQCKQSIPIKQEVSDDIFHEGSVDTCQSNSGTQNSVSNEPIPKPHITVNNVNPGYVTTRDGVLKKLVKIEDATVIDDDITTRTYWKAIDEISNESKPTSTMNVMEADQPNIQDISENVITPKPGELSSDAKNDFPINITKVDTGLIESPYNNHIEGQNSTKKTHFDIQSNGKQCQGFGEGPSLSGSLFVCDKCGEKFNNNRTLKMHMWIHTNEKKFKCGKCGKRFSLRRRLNKHMKRHANDRPHICEVCGKGFKHSYIKIHMRVHTNEKPYECKECGKRFRCDSNLQSHMRIHIAEKPYLCNICGKGFRSPGTRNTHMKCHSDEIPYVCNECGKGFKLSTSLRTHMKCHSDETPYVCSECGKGFKLNGSLKSHMKCHSDERPFICKECGKGFKEARQVTIHMRIHTNEKPYVCKECGKGCTSKSNLQSHMRTHMPEKPFLCNICGKGFRRPRSLDSHLKTHGDETPYACNECGKGFKLIANLKSHMVSHTNERPFICKECGKGFKLTSLLKRHMTSHITERSFICKECGKWFKHDWTLQKHMRTHMPVNNSSSLNPFPVSITMGSQHPTYGEKTQGK